MNKASNQKRRGAWLLVLVTSFIIYHASFAQIGTWEPHPSYQTGQSVALLGNKIYAATQNGFFCYDKTTGEITTLGKQQGLSDVGISRLLYLADQNRLLIAYQNGNLDFVTLSSGGNLDNVKNVNTLAAAQNQFGPATIYHLNRIGNNLYISTSLGILVLDISRDEIRDTYFTQQSDGSRVPVYMTAAANDSLYALTATGSLPASTRVVRAIRLSATVNIADPANWKPIDVPSVPFSSLISYQTRLYGSIPGMGIYVRQRGTWTLSQQLLNPVIQLFPATNGLIVATDQSVTVPGAGSFTGPPLANPRDLVADGNRIWVADQQTGLLAGEAGTFQRIAPEGPTQDLFSSLYTYPNRLVALPSAPQAATLSGTSQVSADLFAVPDNRWQPIQAAGLGRGFNASAYLPTDQRLYLGSYGGGLWSQIDGQPPTSVALPTTVSPFITSLTTDRDNNLWITTSGPNTQQASLHVRRPDGTFQSFTTLNQVNIIQAVPDDNGFLWLRPAGSAGLLVFDPSTNRLISLTTQAGRGNLLTNAVRTLVKDRNGAIWAGTDLGPTVFDNPAGAFDGSIDAQPPLLNRRRLLANEVVTSIAVDGGNRKWIGTQTGLYHVSPDGSQLLDSFTTESSPLPTNAVQSLAIEPLSGRVFIQTSNGLLSYRGPATEPAPLLSKLTIFPNPVRPDFTGTVGINGLTDNATVKLLDAGGQLVYETRSQGGTATWNLHDYRNRPVQTGVYLVVVVTADGTEGLAGKLAVVR